MGLEKLVLDVLIITAKLEESEPDLGDLTVDILKDVDSYVTELVLTEERAERGL